MSKMKRGFVVFKVLRRMLMRILTLSRKLDSSLLASANDDDKGSLMGYVPNDVKEGHFVVHTAEDGEAKRFIIEVSCLTHPVFLKLLVQAAAEFGFKQEGVLAVPCGPSELQRILESVKERRSDGQ